MCVVCVFKNLTARHNKLSEHNHSHIMIIYYTLCVSGILFHFNFSSLPERLYVDPITLKYLILYTFIHFLASKYC